MDIPLYQVIAAFIEWIKSIIVMLGSIYIVPNISLLSIFVGGFCLTIVLSVFWKGEKG